MKITITGIDQYGKQVSETLDVSVSGKETMYSSHCYETLTIGGNLSLSFRVRRLSLWRKFLLRFFKKWPVISGGIQ